MEGGREGGGTIIDSYSGSRRASVVRPGLWSVASAVVAPTRYKLVHSSPRPALFFPFPLLTLSSLYIFPLYLYIYTYISIYIYR